MNFDRQSRYLTMLPARGGDLTGEDAELSLCECSCGTILTKHNITDIFTVVVKIKSVACQKLNFTVHVSETITRDNLKEAAWLWGGFKFSLPLTEWVCRFGSSEFNSSTLCNFRQLASLLSVGFLSMLFFTCLSICFIYTSPQASGLNTNCV